MILVQAQTFYEKATGRKHEVSIIFGGINPISNGCYEVLIDGQKHSATKSKGRAFDEVVNIIKATRWVPVNPI